MADTKLEFAGKRILIAEDDFHLRSDLQAVLEKKGASVRTTENGLVAKYLLDKGEPFDLLLSDIRMPELDGIQLLSHCKANFKDMKVIIFTGFSEYLETKSASELGADGFLSKPFKIAELFAIVGGLLKEVDETSSSLIDEEQQYCCVNIDEFFSTTKLPSDIYIKVGQTKFVKLAHENAEIELPRLQHIKDHKVAFLYVRTNDFHKYTGMNLRIAHALEKSDSVSDEKKMRLFKHTGEMLVQQAFTTDVGKAVYDNASAMVTNTLRAAGENEGLFQVLLSLQKRGDDLYAHGMAVAMHACMIATAIGWNSTANQQKIALAGLFHDVGFKELPPDLATKPRFKMSDDEVRLYESHPLRGRDILKSIEGYPVDLASIIGQHHEQVDGDGYPQGLPAPKIHPLAKLLHLADELSERLSTEPAVTLELVSKVLHDFFENRREEFDREILGGAFDLFKIPRPKGLKSKAA